MIKHVPFSLYKKSVPGHYKYMNNAATNEWTTEELVEFAKAVRTAAGLPATVRYHGELAFIGSIKREYFPRSDRAAFNAKLIAAHQAGLLRLRRADLVGAMDAKLVAESEVQLRGPFMSVEFHFVTVA